LHKAIARSVPLGGRPTHERGGVRPAHGMARAWDTLVIATFLLALLHLSMLSESDNSTRRRRALFQRLTALTDDRSANHMSFSPGYWSPTINAAVDDDIQYGFSLPNRGIDGTDSDKSMTLHSYSSAPLQMVPRVPVFHNMWLGNLVDGQQREGPTAAVYVDRPPPDPERPEVVVPVNCLTTKQPSLRTLPIRQWTVEVVVDFLNNEHFGRAWQTIFGRTGGNFTANEFDAKLAAMAMKLAPDMHLLLEAWVGTEPVSKAPQYVSVRSKEMLEPSTWYHLVGRSNGHDLQLLVNGVLAGEFHSDKLVPSMPLSVPPLSAHGDFTFGCGMHEGLIADACSCLLAEARLSPAFLQPAEWLWRPSEHPLVNPCSKGSHFFSGVCIRD